MKRLLPLHLGLLAGCVAGLLVHNERAQRERDPAVVYPPAPTVALLPRAPGQEQPGLVLANVRISGDKHDADFSRCVLQNVNFEGTDLDEANFGSATIRGCNFDMAGLERADLTDATYDAETKWPAGFDPEAHGARPDDGPRP